MSKLNNLVGRRFGKLVVESLSDKKDKAGNLYWNCICDCGGRKTIAGLSIMYGRTVSCGCYGESQRRAASLKPDKDVASNLLYLKYKNQAERRGIDFDLEEDFFKSLIFQDCYYCGAAPSNSFNNYRKQNHASHLIVLYNGLDRMESTLGYSKENVVPCCQVCNYGKRSLGKDQFLRWIKRVYIKHYHKSASLTPGQLIDLLFTTDYKCWWAQEDLMKYKDTDPEKAAQAAVRAQEYNAKRTKLMRTIDDVFDYSEDTNTEKTYSDGNIDEKENYTYFKKED